MSSDPYPRFVERPGEACHLQPSACLDTQLYGFFLKGDAATMQRRLVDPCLNLPSGGQTDYRVVSNHVMVTYAFAGQGRSTLPPDRDMGWVPETSWTVWIPTAAVQKEFGGHVNVATRLAFYAAYISVDSSWSVAAGREIYGFPKNYGPIEIPAAGQPPKRFSAATTVLERYDWNEEAKLATVMEINQTATTGGWAGAVWSDIESAFKTLAHKWTHETGAWVVPGFRFIDDIYELLRHEAVPSVFLKQFRDAADGRRACYQAILEAFSSVTKLNGGGSLPGSFEATVAEFPSHPICSDLGLEGPTVPVEFPFWVNFNFTIGEGKEIWRAATHA